MRKALLAIICLVSPLAGAGLFDDAQNLQVLPKDISADELRDIMRGQSLGTGFRCNGCHVGEGDDFSTFDFAADDKDTKKTARIMLKMVADINDRLERELGSDTAALVKVECVTCHRGQNKPKLLEQVMAETFADEGLDGTIAKYRELRKKYYGSHTFDFGDMVLVNVATSLTQAGQMPAALDILDLNLEFNSASLMSLVIQGQILASTGELDAARAKLAQALTIDPDNGWVKQQLEGLK